MLRINHDIATGKITEVQLDALEIAELELIAEKALEHQAIIETEMLTKAAEKAALYERLGITADEAKLLLS